MQSSENMNVLPNCPPLKHIQIANPIGSRVAPVLAEDNQSEASKLLDGDDSSSFSEHCADKPRKRRRLILLHGDEEEDAEMKNEDFNHRSLDNGRPPKKQKCVEGGKHGLDIVTSEYSELTLPFKKRRAYRVVNEDEVMVGADDARCAQNDVSKPVVAKDHLLQSTRPFDSEFTDQQCCMNSLPFDEVVWRGTLKINGGVSVSVDAHLSEKTCERVWKLSESLNFFEVVEVTKVPRLEAWPKSWETSGPTDDNIALYFFPPPSTSPTKELELYELLVEEIIQRNYILKSVVSTAELLIFPSTILPDEYQVFQGKNYLWGVFKKRKDECEAKDVLFEQQDGSACAKEGEKQENHSKDQNEVESESPDHGSTTMKHVVHDENELLVDQDLEAREGAIELKEVVTALLSLSALPACSENLSEDCNVLPSP